MARTHLNRNSVLRQLIVGMLIVGLTTGGSVFAQPMQMPNGPGPEDQRPEAQKPQKKDVKKPGNQPAEAPKNGGPYPVIGNILQAITGSYDVVRSGPDEFFFHEGIFYARDPKGYKVVTPPRGCVVGHLPVGFETLVVAGITYFLYAGVYYNQAADGYMVVDAPATPTQTVVVQEVPAETVVKSVVVDVELLNVRSGPGAGYDVVSKVQRGDSLTVEGNADDWYYVQLPDGSHGWVMTQYTRPAAPEAMG